MTKTISIRQTLLASIAISTLGPACQSIAQVISPGPQPKNVAPERSIEQVVVTARRRSESIQKIPVAITAFSGVSLRNKVIKSAQDLQQTTPSLQIENNVVAPAGLQISMRGQVQTDTAANSPGSVSVYIDDVFDGGSALAGGLINLNDLSRVEILKGPQGTLYGRNVTAGLIKFVTNKPSAEKIDGYVTLGLGDYDRHYAEAMVNMPIIKDKLAIRIVGDFDEHSGYSRDIVSNRDLEDKHQGGFRGSIKWDPTPDLDVLLLGYAGLGRDNGADARTTYLQPGLNQGSLDIEAAQHVNGITPATLAPLIFGTAGGFTPAQIGAAAATALAGLPAANALVQQQINAGRDAAEGNPLYKTGDKAQARGAGLTISYTLDDIVLKSITGYSFDRRESLFNVGGGPWTPLLTNQNGSNDEITEELQATGRALDNKLQYAAGIYLLHADLLDTRLDASQDGAFPSFLGQNGLKLLNGSTADNSLVDKSAALYAQASYAVIPDVHVTLGARGTNETLSNTSNSIQLPEPADGGQTLCIGAAPDTAATPINKCAQKGQFSNRAFSYTAGLDWQITPTTLVYAKTSRGFKSGGVNAYPSTYQPIENYQPEVATDYEIGAKAQLLNRRLQIDTALYHTDYKNIQRVITQTIGPGLFVTNTRNAAKATIDGFEADAQFVVLTGLTLSGTAAYTFPKYQSYTQQSPSYPGGVEDLSTEPFLGVARWTTSVSIGYSFTTEFTNMHAQLDWAYKSKADLYSYDEQPPDFGGSDFTPRSYTTQGGYSLVNASFVTDIPKYHSTLTFFGKNILDKRYLVSEIGLVNGGLGVAFGSYGPPATFGVDYTYHF